MDLELKWRDLTWFEVLGRATATHEEALETAIPEYCPDMNRIVDATGQLQIRDREITGGAVMVSGMVSVRVLYSSEESSGLRSLEVSVPFRCTQEGGNLAACRVLRAEGRLLLTEAKAVSARRLYVRVLPEVTVTGYGEMHGRLCCAAEGDASLAVRTRETPLRLLSAVAEKQCPFTQETMLQTGQETPEEVLADRLTLRVTDWQNVGTKLLVKGEARLCVLYRGEQQGLCIHEAARPFSQILDGIEAAEDGECAVEPLVIEAQTRVLRTEGACGFGVSAQVSLFVRPWRQERVQIVEDLYSTRADMAIRREPVRIAFERPLPPVEQEIFEVGEAINRDIAGLLEEGIRAGRFRHDLQVLPTVFAFWAGLSGLIRMASDKAEYIELVMKRSRREFLDYSYELLYRSIAAEPVREAESGD